MIGRIHINFDDELSYQSKKIKVKQNVACSLTTGFFTISLPSESVSPSRHDDAAVLQPLPAAARRFWPRSLGQSLP
jgi:hypothetical protein